MKSLNLWVGIECTLNRVGDQYFDQLRKSKHWQRKDDLKNFAALNPQRIRYPFLWEYAAPSQERNYNWSLFDQNLKKLKEAGLIPIVGLLHHGSGPVYTNLLDKEFPKKFSTYAHDFASRYPELTDYTPINEILTTARFSCLYGHWYPHRKDDRSFIRAFYNECCATILAMQEIRKINPQARLIQTEDIGRCESTKALEYQRNFDNERRWLSFDLLCGKVDSHHPLYEFLLQELTDAELQWIRANACPPNLLGINHYLLSNRFLDERLDLYPEYLHGGNKRQAYADVGIVDTDIENRPTPYSVFKEVWDRYQIPLAITEAHARGYREDQMRWFLEIWQSAEKLMKQGVPIEAVTAWSLLGTYDWNSLCTIEQNFYEPGVFDLRTPDGKPRETGLSKFIKSLTNTSIDSIVEMQPVFQAKGWWSNHCFDSRKKENKFSTWNDLGKKNILITGGSGTLARSFARICAIRNIPFVVVNRNQLDIASALKVREVLGQIKPWAVINAAGHVKVDEAENNATLCFRENVCGPRILAEECNLRGIPLLTFSSDQVFGGDQTVPYLENDDVNPLNIYGQSKAIAERKVLAAHDKSLVVRTSSFFSPWDEYNFAVQCLRSIEDKKAFPAAKDIFMSPTYVPDLVNACLDLLIDQQYGLLHLVNQGEVSWEEFAKAVASNMAKDKTNYIYGYRAIDFPKVARRPIYSVLSSTRYQILPPLEESLVRFFQELEIKI